MMIFLVFFIKSVLGDVYHSTKEESKHIGRPYIKPAIIDEFESTVSDLSKFTQVNDFVLHHQKILSFCEKRTEGCTWIDYYGILDELREPFSEMFDPVISQAKHIYTIQEEAKSGHLHQSTCEIIVGPSPNEFNSYVRGSKPVIIRGLLPSPRSTVAWSLDALQAIIGDTEVCFILIYA
jgi:hypothetical protein